jgi:hypothetical protein
MRLTSSRREKAADGPGLVNDLKAQGEGEGMGGRVPNPVHVPRPVSKAEREPVRGRGRKTLRTGRTADGCNL